MGLPPFGGFFGKYLVMTSVFQEGHPWIGAVFLAGACLTIIYLLRVFSFVFLGVPRGQADLPRECSPVMVGSVVFLALLSALSGLLIEWPGVFARAAVRQMMG